MRREIVFADDDSARASHRSLEEAAQQPRQEAHARGGDQREAARQRELRGTDRQGLACHGRLCSGRRPSRPARSARRTVCPPPAARARAGAASARVHGLAARKEKALSAVPDYRNGRRATASGAGAAASAWRRKTASSPRDSSSDSRRPAPPRPREEDERAAVDVSANSGGAPPESTARARRAARRKRIRCRARDVGRAVEQRPDLPAEPLRAEPVVVVPVRQEAPRACWKP